MGTMSILTLLHKFLKWNISRAGFGKGKLLLRMRLKIYPYMKDDTY